MKSEQTTAGSGSPENSALAKFASLKEAVLDGKPGIKIYRREFLDACISDAETLRVKDKPDVPNPGEMIVQICSQLVPTRNIIIDWVLLESEVSSSQDFSESLVDFLEQFRKLKLRPHDVMSWSEWWFEAHKLFVYDTFLYVVAALLKTRSYSTLHEIYFAQYLRDKSESSPHDPFVRFDDFYAFSETINDVLAPPKHKLYSAAAELVKRNAHRKDIPFHELIQADLLTLLVAFIDDNVRWYPQLMHYSAHSRDFPFFLRATQHKYFLHLATITGINDANSLRTAVVAGHERLQVQRWSNFLFERSFGPAMNIDKLDTIQ